jgi:hypothetical protein
MILALWLLGFLSLAIISGLHRFRADWRHTRRVGQDAQAEQLLTAGARIAGHRLNHNALQELDEPVELPQRLIEAGYALRLIRLEATSERQTLKVEVTLGHRRSTQRLSFQADSAGRWRPALARR